MEKKKSPWTKAGLCRSCKLRRTRDGHDPCIANLPGVIFACCGHGVEDGYMKFEDGRTIYFTPKKVLLNAPTHDLVQRTPVFKKDEVQVELNIRTGKISQKAPGLGPVLDKRTTFEPRR